MYERHGYNTIYKYLLLFLFYIGKLIRLVNIKHFCLQTLLLVTFVRYKRLIIYTLFYGINKLLKYVFICVPHIVGS